MAQTLSKTQSYPTLLKEVRREITTGQLNIQRQLALTYWRIGERIHKHLLKNKSRAGYGEQVIKLLSADLNIHKRTLQRSVRFYQEYPMADARPQFNWTQYRLLLRVDKPQRKALEQKVKRNHLSTRELAREIKQQATGNRQPVTGNPLPVPKLKATKGQLHTYHIITPQYI